MFGRFCLETWQQIIRLLSLDNCSAQRIVQIFGLLTQINSLTMTHYSNVETLKISHSDYAREHITKVPTASNEEQAGEIWPRSLSRRNIAAALLVVVVVVVVLVVVIVSWGSFGEISNRAGSWGISSLWDHSMDLCKY